MIVSGRYLDNTIKYNITNPYNIHNTHAACVVSDRRLAASAKCHRAARSQTPRHNPPSPGMNFTQPTLVYAALAVTFTLWHVRDPCLSVHLQMLPVSSSNTNKCLAEVFYLKKFRFLNYSYYNILQFASWSGSLHFSLRQFYDWMTRSILNSQLVLSVETAVAANARWQCPHSYWFLMRILDTDVVFLHCCLAPCQHLLILMVVFILEIMVLLHLKEVEYPLKKVCFSCNNVTYYSATLWHWPKEESTRTRFR